MSPGFFQNCHNCDNCCHRDSYLFFHNCNNGVIRSQLYPFFHNCHNCNNCALNRKDPYVFFFFKIATIASVRIHLLFFFKIAIIATIVVTRCVFCAIFSWQLHFPTILCYYRYCELSRHIAIIARAFVYSVLLLQFLYFRIARNSTTFTKRCYLSNCCTIIAQNCTTWTYDLHNCLDNCVPLLFCAIIAVVSYRAFMQLLQLWQFWKKKWILGIAIAAIMAIL